MANLLLLVLIVLGLASLAAGVGLLVGPGWALIAASGGLLFLASVIARGLRG